MTSADDAEYSYVLTADEMVQVERILRDGTQEDCDLIERIFHRAKVKWYELPSADDVGARQGL